MKKLIITKINWKDRMPLVFSLFDDGKPESFYAFTEKAGNLVNSIYIGRVEKIAQNINAAFVRFADDMIGYLALEEARSPVYTRKQSKALDLRPGDEILVQVTKDAVKTKLPVLTARISFHGPYFILTAGSSEIGVSRKITKERADQLRALGQDLPLPSNTGLLFRTSAASIPDHTIAACIKVSSQLFEKMLEESIHLKAGSLVQAAVPGYIDRMKSLNFEDILVETDDSDIYEKIGEYFPSLPAEGKLSLYTDQRISLAALHSLSHYLDLFTQKQVWLKSGANLIIEQLETLTFIDINTAKNEKGTSLQVNIEAATEIARQLRMRNLSGMILIDFINMPSEEENQELIRHLKAMIASDPVKCKYIDMTGLGLIELTRQKKEKSLAETLK